MQEGIDFLYCNICLSLTGDSEEYQAVGYHLKLHKIKGKEYREMFQDVPVICLKDSNNRGKGRLKYYATDKGKGHKKWLSNLQKNHNIMFKYRENFDKSMLKPERTQAIRESVLEQYRTGKKETPENFINSKTIHGYFYSKKNQKKFHYRSGIELKAYTILEKWKDVLKYEDEKTVKIIWGNGHTYHPDILVWFKNGKKLLVECKPKYLVETGGFTGNQREASSFIEKIEAAEEYCRKMGWNFEIWTDKCLGL